MKYVVKIGYGTMIHIPSFMKIVQASKSLPEGLHRLTKTQHRDVWVDGWMDV
jgi:hypothetical protein